MRQLVFTALAGALTFAAAAQTEDAPLVMLETADDSRGWDGVGKLILGDNGFCTGALIAPQLVLTAGHCLYDKVTGVQLRPEEIEFQAGVRNGRALAYRRVARAVTHPDYRHTSTDSLDRVTADLALLELSQPILLPSLQPFVTGASPVDGDSVAVISYAQDRAEAPTIQQACEVLASQKTALVLTCSVDFGSSGAPVFVVRGGVAQLVAVISAKAEADGRKVSVAVPVVGATLALADALAASHQGARLSPKGVSILSGGVDPGAKFITP